MITQWTIRQPNKTVLTVNSILPPLNRSQKEVPWLDGVRSKCFLLYSYLYGGNIMAHFFKLVKCFCSTGWLQFIILFWLLITVFLFNLFCSVFCIIICDTPSFIVVSLGRNLTSGFDIFYIEVKGGHIHFRVNFAFIVFL